MFDVGDLPVLTFGNCVLKTGVIKWPLKLRGRFFLLFFKFQKHDFLRCLALLHECAQLPPKSLQHTEHSALPLIQFS